MDTRGEHRFSAIISKKKGKILVVFYVAGKRKLFFIHFEVFTWKKRLNFPDYTTDIV